MLDIENNILSILKSIPSNIELIAVTKTVSIENIVKALNCGIKSIGENRLQEALLKYEKLKSFDIKWHLIGSLQNNKIGKAVKIFDLIQSVDTVNLAETINKKASEINKTQNILIQINISEEETKSGFINNEDLFENLYKISKMNNISVKGLMTIAKNTDDKNSIKKSFSDLKNLKSYINNKKIFPKNLEVLSMGMSNDYNLAIEEGSNMIRLGKAIFGDRL